MSEIFDAAIIGAGAAGMTAAGKAGENGLKTVILEKKSRPGIKLSITGKGRCNITNSAAIKEFVKSFRNGEFLYSSFSTFSNEDTISFFENLGIPCVLERGGRYFPKSGKALDIVNALIKYAKHNSSIKTSFEVFSAVKTKENIFIINNEIKAKNIIIACGGMSYPSTGSTGDGYKIATAFGHSISAPLAALVPVFLKCNYLSELKGLKLKNVNVSVICGEKTLSEEFGEMEFTVFGADGPVILTLSGLISEKIKENRLTLSLNLKPALTKEQLSLRVLKELDAFGQYQLKEMLKELLPIQIIKPFIDYCGLQMTKKCSQINKTEREIMLKALHDFRFDISGVKDLKEAIITRGGVLTDEIDQKTMQSKIVKGLYFCGEVIDIDAPTGGFNLQAAFSTGYLAGNSVKTENS